MHCTAAFSAKHSVIVAAAAACRRDIYITLTPSWLLKLIPLVINETSCTCLKTVDAEL